MQFSYFIFSFLLALLVIGTVATILRLLLIPFRKWLIRTHRLSAERSKQIKLGYRVSIIAASLCLAYSAVFPGEGFYEFEYEKTTLRKLPGSAEFIEKNVSSSDLHGHYHSYAQIRLSRKDYQDLMAEFSQDSRMSAGGTLLHCDELSRTLGNKSEENIVSSFERKNATGDLDRTYVGFYNDSQTIFVGHGDR